jgi:DNA polymerase III beta subunit
MITQLLPENLKAALNYVKAAASKTGLLHIEAKSSQLIITSQSSEMTLQTSVKAKVQEEGEVNLTFHTTSDYVNSLSSDTIEVKVDRNSLQTTVAQGRFSAKFKGDDQFKPIIKRAGSSDFIIAGDVLALIGSRVGFAAATNDAITVLNGVHWTVDEVKGELTAAATDGFRLSVLKVAISRTEGRPKRDPYQWLIPGKALQEICGRFASSEVVQVSGDDVRVTFDDGTYFATVQQISGANKFPEYERIIPDPSRRVGAFVVNADEVVKATKTIRPFSGSDNICTVKVTPPAEQRFAVVSGNDAQTGDAARPLMGLALVEGNVEPTRLNYHFLEDGAKATKGLPVELNFFAVNQPIVMRVHGNTDYRYVMMPMVFNR